MSAQAYVTSLMSSLSMVLRKQAVVSIVPIGMVSGLRRIISTIGSSMVKDRRSDADGPGQVQGGKEGLTHECECQGIRKGDGEKKK